MEYKDIKNITDILVDFFRRNENHSENILKNTFTDDTMFEPAYRLAWITPDGTTLFEDNPRSSFKRKTDHKRTILLVLKKYYSTLNVKNKQNLLKTFFGDIYNNQHLIDFFEAQIIYTEDLSRDLWGSFKSKEYPQIIKHKNGEVSYIPLFTNYMARFMFITGIVRLRLKPVSIDKQIPEETGFNIQAHTNLTLHQSQFLREFILLNDLQIKKSVFIDDNTTYKTLLDSLGLNITPKFNSFGHAYRILDSKQTYKRELLNK
jgi:hypothetical protein